MQIEINRIDDYSVDNQKLSYYENYFLNNFYSHFEYNLGTEIILDYLSEINSVNYWMDLGAGASSLFWALPMTQINNIFCNEITIEPFLIFNNEILRKNQLPICYNDILKMYHKDFSQVDYLKSKMTNFHIFDAMKSWSIQDVKFDLITQFGTFGLSKDADSYIQCINYAFDNLTVGGRMIGANWIFKENFAKERQIDNSYLNTNLIHSFAKERDCVIIDNQIINIVDENYKSVLIWYLQKK
jgi:hypothetical protein